jgi:hypothetical protein
MKSKSHAVIIVIVSFILNCFSTVYANNSTPDSVVRKYYQADFDGVRLSAEGYKRIKPLISWENEPGWDLVFITKEANIEKIDYLTNDEAKVTIIYRVIGILNGDDLIEIEFNQMVTFVLVRTTTQWKIKQPIINPHVSQLAMSKHIEKVLKDNKDKTREIKLRTLIKRLQEF